MESGHVDGFTGSHRSGPGVLLLNAAILSMDDDCIATFRFFLNPLSSWFLFAVVRNYRSALFLYLPLIRGWHYVVFYHLPVSLTPSS